MQRPIRTFRHFDIAPPRGVIVVRLIATLQGQDPPSGIVGMAAVVASVTMAVALLATWIPARRAADVDPLVALRIE